jgi:hypothetical protein
MDDGQPQRYCHQLIYMVILTGLVNFKHIIKPVPSNEHGPSTLGHT